MRHLRGRLTYANVVATLALFLALGGATAFAAGQLARNSVGTKQLKNNAVTTAKIKKNAVTGTKIKNGTITGEKVNLGSLGTVPSASSAASAAEAAAVNGLHLAKIHYTATGDTPPTTVFSGAGLTLTAECKNKALEFTATTAVGGAQIFESGNFLSSFEGNFNEEFNPGEVEHVGELIGDDTQDENQGQLVYSNPAGAVVTAQFGLNEAFTGGPDCSVRGIAEYS